MCLIVLQNLLNIFWFSETDAADKKPVHSALKSAQKLAEKFTTVATTENHELGEAAAIMVWWTPFIGEMEYTKSCGDSVCFFTGKREYLRHQKAKVSCDRS